MPVTSIEKSLDDATMTIVADHSVPVSRLWDAYRDPRQIELFWGPPGWPAVFTRHDGFVGGISSYAMHGPEGEISAGQWDWVAVDDGSSFEVIDRFRHPDGTVNDALPAMRMKFSFAGTDRGSRMTSISYFSDAAALQELLDMGVEEGTQAAMSQVDAVLADGVTFKPGQRTTAKLIGEFQVRIDRGLRASLDDVWRAHHEAEIVQKWLLGPPGWSMPECVIASSVGDTYRYRWQSETGPDHVASTGKLLELHEPRREVVTEQMTGTGMPAEPPATTNEQTFIPVDGGTLVSLLVTYPDATTRDLTLASGMIDGMEDGYRRLEGLFS